jgi:hypothetical protein
VILVPKVGILELADQILGNNEGQICRKQLPRRKETEDCGNDKERGAIHIYCIDRQIDR